MASNHEHRRRRKMVIASSSSFLLLLLVVGMVAVSMNQAEEKSTSNTGTILSSTKLVQAICASTDYKQTCEKSLIKLAHNTTSDPKEILKAAIVAVIGEISTSFSHSTLFKSNDSRVLDAIDDCWEMYQDSKEDLVKTLNKIIGTADSNPSFVSRPLSPPFLSPPALLSMVWVLLPGGVWRGFPGSTAASGPSPSCPLSLPPSL